MKIKIFSVLSLGLFSLGFSQQNISMDQALAYALENNINIKKAKIDKEIAVQKVKETIGIGLPQVKGTGNYNYFLNIPVQLLPAEIAGGPHGQFIPVKFGQKQSLSGGLSVQQLLFNGSYLVGLESVKAYRETSNLAEEKVQLSIKEAIMMAYTAVLVMDENIATLLDNQTVLAKSLHDTKQTYKQGLIEFQNVEQLEYSFSNLSNQLENLKRSRQQYLNSLKYILGMKLEEKLLLTTNLNDLLNLNKILVATEENPDVKKHIDYKLKSNEIRLSQLKLKLQKSKALPVLALGISSTYNAYSQNFTFLNSNQNYFNSSVIALQLDVPIFSGFQRKWQTEQAKLDLKKVELEKEDLEKNLKNEIFSKSIEYQNAFHSLETAQKLINLSSSIFKKEQIRFKEGLGSSFNLQNSETQLYQSQAQYYQSALQFIQSKIKLDKAQSKL